VIGVVVVAALYFGREVLVPIALAILLSFVLSPLVRILRSWYFPRAVAVLLVVFVAFVAIFALGTLMVSQVNELAADLPRYQYSLQEKIDTLRGGFSGTGTLERASEVLQDLKKEIEKPKAEQTSPPIDQPTPSRKPLPVEVIQPDPGALQTSCGSYCAADPSAHDHGDRCHFCHFHSSPTARSKEQASTAGGRWRSPAHNGGARRRRRAAESVIPDPACA
jgi:AI-2E family transporter